MTITTKFDEGDQIFFLLNSKAVTTVVRGVTIERRPQSPGVTVITYLCHESPDIKNNVHIKVFEVNAFATKEELIKSL